MAMPDFITHLVTGKDNKTHDIARWSWLLTTLVVIVGAGYNAYTSNLFGLKDFAQAIGMLAGAHGAAVWAKKDTEPEAPEPDAVPYAEPDPEK